MKRELLLSLVGIGMGLASWAQHSPRYSASLETFFTNSQCTELKANYAEMSDADLKAEMANAGLPKALQNIAVKVKNNWWNETEKSAFADENIYAKDFRVASYKPYSDANDWHKKLNCYAPCYMGNPTGIYAHRNDTLHVFVGNEIPEDATLYLSTIRNHGLITSRTAGTELKKGYNEIIVPNDSLVYFVNYVVNTIDPTYWKDNDDRTDERGKTIARLSDFPAMDIHIEGGDCVGYYQKPLTNSEQEDEKFRYLTTNASDKMFFMVKGETTLFYFPKETFVNVWPKTIWNSINWFDRVQYWEYGLIGILDNVANGLCENGTEYSKSEHPFNIKGGDAFYPTYCNNPSFAIQGASSTPPFATTYHTSFPGEWGVESSFNAERQDFDNWCCGHEHGHTIQGAYNLESCIESSVNLGSQLVTYMTGYRMSRGWNFDDNYNYTADKVPFGLRSISITMRMYWNLYLYYHVAGKKKDFYPTFVKSLREDPMDFTHDDWRQHPIHGGAGHHRAVNTWIKFYKKACEAAQEDLTEYFRMWGFFEPCNYLFIPDQKNYWASLTQEEIDAAIAEVKAKGYKENLQIMFVEDRQILRPRTDIWASTATGTAKNKPENNGKWKSQAELNSAYGDVGDILTYIDGSGNTSEYKYILSGNSIKMIGEGGVGFIVYDKDGKNVHMSNRLQFDIPLDVAINGFEVKAINADGTTSTAVDGTQTATEEDLREILQSAINISQPIIDLEDETGKKIGYYNSKDLATLKGLVADAESAIATNDKDNYLSLSTSINNEYLRLQNDGLMQSVKPNALYYIKSKRNVSGNAKYLSTNSQNKVVSASSSNISNQWAFVPASAEDPDIFYLQHKKTYNMMQVQRNDKGKITAFKLGGAEPESASSFKLVNLGDGVLGIRPLDQTYLNIDPQGTITSWDNDDEGSQWYITEADTFVHVTDDTMRESANKIDDLIDDVCIYEMNKEKVALQCTDPSQPNYLSTNQPEEDAPDNVLGMAIDGDEETFFMSNRSNNAMTFMPHHLRVDLGEGNEVSSIQFRIKGNSAWNWATQVNVWGADDSSEDWISSITDITVDYTSPIFNSLKPSRYWRIDVIATDGEYEDESYCPWFTVCEFEFFKSNSSITMKPGYEELPVSYITDCKEKIKEVERRLEEEYYTPLTKYELWLELMATYNALYEKIQEIDPTVDIQDIEATGNSNGEIYDLSGRKLRDAKAGGIYIIGGKKIIR